MRKLLLFDIDGTILTGPSTGRFVETAHRLHGKKVKYEKDMAGQTDYLIMKDILFTHGWSIAEIEKATPKIMRALEEVHKEVWEPEGYQLAPGTKPLLEKLANKDVELGLLTGNVKSIAKRKLSSFGVWKYFKVGAYGDDAHKKRSDLVKLAVKRAGYENKLKDVYIIGDAPNDIIAAKEAGVKSVGVSNGFRPLKELIDEGADIVLKDLKDTDLVIKSLGI